MPPSLKTREQQTDPAKLLLPSLPVLEHRLPAIHPQDRASTRRHRFHPLHRRRHFSSQPDPDRPRVNRPRRHHPLPCRVHNAVHPGTHRCRQPPQGSRPRAHLHQSSGARFALHPDPHRLLTLRGILKHLNIQPSHGVDDSVVMHERAGRNGCCGHIRLRRAADTEHTTAGRRFSATSARVSPRPGRLWDWQVGLAVVGFGSLQCLSRRRDGEGGGAGTAFS